MARSAAPTHPAAPPAGSSAGSRKGVGSLRMVGRVTSRYPARIVVALLALITSACATLFIPRTFQRVVDHGFAQGGTPHAIASYFEQLLAVVIVLALATAVRFYTVSWLGERTVADIRIAVHANLLRLAPRYFEENRPSEIASRLTADTGIIEQAVGSTVSIALRNAVVGFGGLIYLFTLAPKLAGALVLGIPLLVLPIALLGRKVRSYSKTSQDRLAEVGATAVETLGAMKVVQAFGQQAREGQRFEHAVEENFATARRRFALRAVMTSVVIGLLFGGVTLILWDAVQDVASGRLSGGALTAFVLTAGIVTGAFGALTEVWGDVLRAAGAADRLSTLLAEQPEIAPPVHPVPLPAPALGALTFENVTFHYPTRREVSALDGLNLAIAPGETVAVVGPSGAGKSTLFQLAERFYDPDGGRITFDGVDLRDVDPADLRARIALVPQETVIFGASARDNLRYGVWEADDERIWAAAEAANAAEFLRRLPDGLDTFLGEGGARLSGGQRQRLTIARALLRDAPLLLLDEATSALDAESERLVQQALERLMMNRTTLVIAHRLATVRAAERIIVMDEGRIVEQGSHADLMDRQGLYARLASLQFHDHR